MVVYKTKNSVYRTEGNKISKNSRIIKNTVFLGALPRGIKIEESTSIHLEGVRGFNVIVREIPELGEHLLYLPRSGENNGWSRIGQLHVFISEDYLSMLKDDGIQILSGSIKRMIGEDISSRI